MKRRRHQLSLPLLTKELTEIANRRRTYIVRTIYALLFMCIVGFIYLDQLAGLQNDPMAILGRGRNIFKWMINLQFGAIYLFLPAITCGVITQEKERNSLGLLLITRLSPFTIIMEKYLGRLITMASFLMLSLPILAFAYALGGISPAMFVNALWMLTITMFQVAALGVMCSSYFRSTVTAFIATYILEIMLFGLCGFGTVLSVNETSSIIDTLIFSFPILISTFLFLLFAHYFLVRRAFVPPSNFLLNIFKALDQLFTEINNNPVTRGVELVKDRNVLPDNEPIAWRETAKKSLGTVRYQFRILVAIEVPVFLICQWTATNNPQPVVPGISILLFLVWGTTVLLLAVSTSSLISAERTHETLDVLLTVPISGKELINQKIKGVKRLCFVLLVPLLTIVFFESWWKWVHSQITSNRANEFESQWLPYLVGSLITITIYLPMLIWLFCWIGMKIKSQTKAILSSLSIVILWCMLPFILAFPVLILNPAFDENSILYGVFLSPVSYIVMNEYAAFSEFGSAWIPLLVNTLIYGICYYLFRSHCIRHIDENLGRLTDLENSKDQSSIVSVQKQSLVSSEQ